MANVYYEKKSCTYGSTCFPENNLKYKDDYTAPKITEKLVEVPHILHQQKVVAVPKLELVQRVIPVHKTHFVEKVLEVPQYKFKEVPVEKVVTVPEIRTEVVLKEVEVPQSFDVAVPQPRQIFTPQLIQKNVAYPVQLNTVQNFRMPKLKPKYVDVTVPIYVPRYIEVPVPVQFYEVPEDNKNTRINAYNIFNKNIFNNNIFNTCLNRKNSIVQIDSSNNEPSTNNMQTVDEEEILGLTERSVSQDLNLTSITNNNNEISSKEDIENNFSSIVMPSEAEVKA